MIDLTNFKKAILSLEKALNEYRKDNDNDFVRDSCIQRFEYCYDATKKILIRYLKSVSDDPMEIDQDNLSNNIRKLYKLNITKHSWNQWDIYRNDRNNTSHGYNENLAIEIVDRIPLFYNELLFIIERLEENLNNNEN